MHKIAGVLAALVLTTPALAQSRQPAQITSQPSVTPQQFEVLDKTGKWLPLGAAGGEPVDVRLFGADPAAADNTVAITAAAASGKNLYFPEGTWKFGNISLTGDQRISCAGVYKTILAQISTTGDFITMSGRYNGIDHCQLRPTVRTTGYQVSVLRPCFMCSMTDFFIAEAFNGILNKAGNQFTLSHGRMGSMLGTTGIRFEGIDANNRANNLIITDVLINNAYPGGYGTVVTWAASTAYVVNNITRTNGVIYQQTAATCTSASSGTGPSGFPTGTDLPSVWAGRITDGTCQWQFISNSLVGLNIRNWAHSVSGQDFSVLNNYIAVQTADDLGSPGDVTFDYPAFINLDRATGDHNFVNSFNFQGGQDIQLTNVFACSNLTGVGIQTGGNFLADLRIVGGRICDNWASGISLAAGAQITVTGASIGSNSMRGSGLSHNVAVSSGVSNFSITNNNVGRDGGTLTARAGYGVIVLAGASDYYVITGNICGGNTVTGCVIDTGVTGTHKTVSGNW